MFALTHVLKFESNHNFALDVGLNIDLQIMASQGGKKNTIFQVLT